MSKSIIDADTLSQERKGVFDRYMNLIEKVKLENVEAILPDFNIVLKSLVVLERNLDDLPEKYINLGNNEIIENLKKWFPVFESLALQEIFIIPFSYNLLALSNLVKNIKELEKLTFRKFTAYLSPLRQDLIEFERAKLKNLETYVIKPGHSGVYHVGGNIIPIAKGESTEILNILDEKEKLVEKDTEEDKITILDSPGLSEEKIEEIKAKTEQIEIEISLIQAKGIINRYTKNSFPSIDSNFYEVILTQDVEEFRKRINQKNIIQEIEAFKQPKEGDEYVWDYKVIIENDNPHASKVGFLIWSLSKSLELIEGVEVYLEDWGNGSKWFKLKSKMKGTVSRDEVKEVLEKGKEALKSEYLDKPIEDVKKTRVESERIKKEIDLLPSKDEGIIINKLDIERKKLELEEKKADIQNKKADAYLKKVQAIRELSSLIKEGILQNDSNMQLMINDLLYLEKKDDEVILGENIEIIEEGQIIENKNEISEDDDTQQSL